MRKSLFQQLYNDTGRWVDLQVCVRAKLVGYAQTDKSCMRIQVKALSDWSKANSEKKYPDEMNE